MKIFKIILVLLVITTISSCIGVCDEVDCENGLLDIGEEGVDCGSCCTPCPSCFDGILNGEETGIDCGVYCPNQCSAPASCSNGIMDGDETAVDCGGSICPPCTTLGANMYGIYDGNTQGPFYINIPPFFLDSVLFPPGEPSTVTITNSNYPDSVRINFEMNSGGTVFNIIANGHITSSTSFTIPAKVRSFVGSVNALGSGGGSVTGNDLQADFTFVGADGATTSINADVDFSGTRP